MCLLFNCNKCFSSVGTGTPYMMIWDCCLPLSHAPADSLTHLQSDGQNGIKFLVMKLKLLVSQGGGESGFRPGETETKCHSRLEPGVPIHLRCPDQPQLTVLSFVVPFLDFNFFLDLAYFTPKTNFKLP